MKHPAPSIKKEMYTYIDIDEEGNISMFDDDWEEIIGEDKNFDIIKVQRLGWVTPRNPVLRFLFKFIRWITFQNRYVVKWTRTWKCKWQLQFTRYFDTREEAVNAEKLIVRFLGEINLNERI